MARPKSSPPVNETSLLPAPGGDHAPEHTEDMNQVRQLLDDLAEACLIADPAGRMLYANSAARQLLRLEGRVLGRKLPAVLADHQALAVFEEAARHLRPRAAILSIAFSSQGSQPWRVSVTPFSAGGTDLLRIALSRRAEVPLADGVPQPESVAVLQKLGDPLSIIQGYLENLLDGVIKDPATMRQCLSAMQRQTAAMQRMLATLRM